MLLGACLGVCTCLLEQGGDIRLAQSLELLERGIGCRLVARALAVQLHAFWPPSKDEVERCCRIAWSGNDNNTVTVAAAVHKPSAAAESFGGRAKRA